jgi:hypothetical protein
MVEFSEEHQERGSAGSDAIPEYEYTEVSVTVSRRVQIEQYEPFNAGVTLDVAVSGDASNEEISALTEHLHDEAKEAVQRDITRRVEEQQMLDQLDGED